MPEPTGHAGPRYQGQAQQNYPNVWGFLKLGVPFWGFPIIRIIVFGVYIGVPLFLGNYYLHLKGLEQSNSM